MKEHISLSPIGYVRNGVTTVPSVEYDWDDVESRIEIAPIWETCLEGLNQYSHLIVIYWAHLATDKEKMALKVHYKGNENLPEVGLFASRSPYRPNPLCLKVSKLISIKNNIMLLRALDAIDGSPVIDIKPFIPSNDSPESPQVPY